MEGCASEPVVLGCVGIPISQEHIMHPAERDERETREIEREKREREERERERDERDG